MRYAARMTPRRLVVLPFLLLAACAGLPGSRTSLLHERWVESAVSGRGGPVVVFESGLGANLRAWEKVVPAVAGFTTAFAWSRPGLGASEPVEGPRTGRVVVEELRALLRAQGLAPPYVLVGHSLGGLYLQWFARRYPEEVAGLVLVDSSHPAQMAGALGRPRVTLGTMLVRLYMTGVRGREFRGLNPTGEDVLAAPTYEGPVTVINAGRAPSGEPTWAERLRLDLARQYPHSRLQWVDSGHNVQAQHPDVVIDAIRQLVEQARAR